MNRLIKRLSVLILLIFSISAQVWAESHTYRARMTATLSSVSPTGSGNVYVNTSNSTSGATFGTTSTKDGSVTNQSNEGGNVTFYLFARAETGYEFYGWANSDGTESTASTDSPWTTSIYSNTESSDNPATDTKYAVFKALPKFYFTATATATPAVGGTATASVEAMVYGEHWNSTSATTSATFTAIPDSRYYFKGWSETPTGAIVSSSGNYPVTLTNNSAGSTFNKTLYAQFEPLPDPTNISANDVELVVGQADRTVTYNLTPTSQVYNYVVASGNSGIVTVNPASVENSPNNTGTFTLHAVSKGTTTLTLTAKKSDGTTACTTTVNVTVKEKCATPVIRFTDNGDNATTTITCSTAGALIYYTTNGLEPNSTNGTLYTEPFTVQENQTVKAIGMGDLLLESDVASNSFNHNSGVFGQTVVLNDYEDHTWTYYAGVDARVDDGNYNTNYVGKIYSPNPRNVKITYTANGGAVSISENQNVFIYYETLEESATAGEYKYQVISNPFSKRPKINGKVQGFNGWEIVRGGDKIKGKANGQVLALDEEIVFENLPYPNVNCTSAEIELKATWVDANVTYITSNPGSDQTYSFTGGTYETNFIVLKKVNYSRTMTINSPCTIMMVEPDGSVDYRNSYTFTGNITPNNSGVTKIENAKWNPSGNIDAKGMNFTIGRGMTMGGTARLYGTNTEEAAVNQVVKIESGKLSSFYHYGKIPSSITQQIVVFGNDYDRAKNDNTKLDITGICKISYRLEFELTDSKTMLCRTYSKSGKIMSNVAVGDAATENVYYYAPDGSDNNYRGGCRYLEIQGGEWCCIAGGFDNYHASDDPAFTFRMKGGLVRGSVYGAGEFYSASGNRFYVLTGGQIKGWLAAGANGTQSSGGKTNGTSFVYVGGNARIDSEGSTTLINKAVGGNVFGAGCGYSSTSSSGEMTKGTNVVVADNAYVERGVYGGGGYGFTTQTANIYVTGGTVKGVYQTTNQTTIPGGVFGGAQQNKGGDANIYMTDGAIQNGGLYGGSNSSGTLSGNVTMHIEGGQVGTAATPASVYGGGYGQNTVVSGTVNIDVKGTPVITGNLYGGSYAGKVDNKVTINVGESGSTSSVPQINNVFGAGQGSTSQVTDAIEVNIDNGLILGSVFGGSEEGQVTNYKGVVVNMAAGTVKGSVYGGGDRGTSASYDVVNMTGGIVEGNVFAGAKGNDATKILVGGVKTLNMQGGTVYGSVYGGSESASDGNTVGTVPSSFTETAYTSFVNVSGGDIRQHVYGGGYFGRMSGSVDVNVGRTAIQKSNSANVNAKYPETLGSLNIRGSVYAGSNWGDFTGGDFGAPTTSGYSNIYIDGTDYNNGLDENGLLTGNYINIGMSIYGAGTSCEAGAKGRKIWIRNYGQKVWGMQELNDGTRDQYEVLTSATRRLYSIQRCDELIMDNSHIDFIGQGDMTKTINTIEYAIVNVDGKITGDNASTVGFKLVNGSSVITEDAIDYIASIGSFATDKDIYSNPSYSLICIGNEDLAFHIGTYDGANFGNDVSGKPKENAFRINGGYSINVRYAADNNGTVNYGALKGFFRIIAAKNQMSFAYSRIKDVETFGGSRYTDENNTDGGFLSYLPSHNNMNDDGAAGTNGLQHPYTNVIAGAKADRTDFRYWKVIATNDAQHVTETANLQATVQSDSSDQYIKAAEVTVKLTPAIPGCDDSYFKISNVDFGDNVSLLDAALYETGNKTYMYYDEDFKTTEDASQQTVAAALANMKDHANNFFGLVMKSGDCFQIPQDYLVSSTSIEHIKAFEFTTKSNPNGELPTMKFLLTYSNNISLNQVLSPVTITFEQYDCSGNVVATIDVPLTITTSTVLGQDITVQTYAMFGGALGTGNENETYTVKVTMPTFTQTTNIGNVVFSVGNATFTPETKDNYTTSAVSVPAGKDHDLNYAMEVRRGLNFDNKNGWIESGEGDFMDYVDLVGGQYVNLGSADGRKTFTIDFKLHYNSTNPEEGYMDQGKVGTFTFHVKYNLNGHDEDFSISVEVLKRTQLKRFYIDGVNGDNINSGTYPDLAKRTLQSIYDAGYVPGDQIIVVKPVTHSGNYNLVWTNASFGDKLVTLYRYSGGHALGVESNTDPGQNTGALLIVSSDMDVNGIVFDGLDNLNGHIDNNLNPKGSFIQPMASLIQVVKGSDDAEEGGTLILEGGSQLINNYNFDNAGSNGNYGGGVYVDGFSSITLRDGTVIKDNTVIYGNGSANNGGGIYADGKVYVSGKVMVTGNKLGDWDDNVYLKDANDYITIEETIGLDLTSVIGVTKDAFPTTGNVDFTPIAYSVYPEQIEEAYNKKSVFVDDQGIYFQYYSSNTEDGFDPNTLYFGKTWAAVVREEPENFNPDNIDSNEDLAWIISLVNGLNHQSVATEQDYTVKSDLNMNEHIWLPIGNKENSFKGEFNGEGHAIDGIRIQYLNDLEAAGMFGFTEGTINNVFVTSGLIEPYAVSETTENFIGGLAGVISAGGVINGSEAAVTLNANSDNVVIGGLAGLIEGGEVHSSMSMPTMNGYEMGGLAGRIKPGAFLKNSFANVDMSLASDAQGTIYTGGLVAYNEGLTDNCYVRLGNVVPGSSIFGMFAGFNGGEVYNCYSPVGASHNYVGAANSGANLQYYGTYSATETPYLYKHGDNNIAPVDSPSTYYTNAKDDTMNDDQYKDWPIMLRTLNQWVKDHEGYEPWMRTSADGINNDYPIHKFDGFVSVASADGRILEYKKDFGEMIGKYNKLEDGGTIDLYANADLTESGDNAINGEKVTVYINEDVALLQPDDKNLKNVYVGITLDNSAGANGANSNHPNYEGSDEIDWHMFSTSLKQAPLGINYYELDSETTDNVQHEFSFGHPASMPYYRFAVENDDHNDGYFPSHVYGTKYADGKNSEINNVDYYEDWDFYCFHEPAHHWINFKRNSNSHYDEDPATGHASIAYSNENNLIQGKGYLLALKETAFLQCNGELNNGVVTSPGLTNTSNPYTQGYNLIGNPYQSYLDFDKLAEHNKYGEENSKYIFDTYYILDEDARGYVAYTKGATTVNYLPTSGDIPEGYAAPGKLINMHQGFFVYVPEDVPENKQNVEFDNKMRSITKDESVAFRGERPSYPIVNLAVVEGNGNCEYLTVETNRPELGGAKKMKGLRAGNSQIFAHAGDEDYSILFATEDMNEVPVRFNTVEDGVYTMIWNTHNAEYSELKLIDNIAGVTVDMLSASEYKFTANASDYASRFRLVFASAGDENDSDESEDVDFAFFDGSNLVVNGTGILSVCDVEGRVLYYTKLNDAQNSVAMPDMARGLYLLYLTNNESAKVQKIVIRK